MLLQNTINRNAIQQRDWQCKTMTQSQTQNETKPNTVTRPSDFACKVFHPLGFTSKHPKSSQTPSYFHHVHPFSKEHVIHFEVNAITLNDKSHGPWALQQDTDLIFNIFMALHQHSLHNPSPPEEHRITNLHPHAVSSLHLYFSRVFICVRWQCHNICKLKPKGTRPNVLAAPPFELTWIHQVALDASHLQV